MNQQPKKVVWYIGEDVLTKKETGNKKKVIYPDQSSILESILLCLVGKPKSV